MCALAVWTVPTFAFGLVGVACLLVARRQVRVLVAWAGTVLVVAVGLYLPILRGVVNARTTWGSQAAPLVYSGNVLRNSLYLTAFGPATYVLAACAVGAGVLVWAFRGGRVQPPEGSEHVGQVGREAIADSSDVLPFLTVYAATHLVLLEMGGLSRILHTPYQRNSVFVAFVILLWLLRLCRSPHQRFRRLARLVLAANLLVSAVGISMLVTGHDYSVQRYDVVLRTAPPTTLRSVPSTGATLVECATGDAPVCRAYRRYLARRGVAVRRVGARLNERPCLFGHTHLARKFQAHVFRLGQPLGELCDV